MVSSLDVSCDLERLRLARVCNDIVVVWTRHWSHALLEQTGEEVIPGLVSQAGIGGIAFEHFVELVLCLPNICNVSQLFFTVRAEPAAFCVLLQNGCRFWGAKVLCPDI